MFIVTALITIPTQPPLRKYLEHCFSLLFPGNQLRPAVCYYNIDNMQQLPKYF